MIKRKCIDKTKTEKPCTKYAVINERCNYHEKKYLEAQNITSTYTFTFCECGENHKGMQMIGERGTTGYTNEELIEIKQRMEEENYNCELINLLDYLSDTNVKNEVDNKGTYLLIIRNAINLFCDDKELLNEIKPLEWDKKALMYGRVVNKNARHNLCFGDESQEPDYKEGKGRIIGFNELPVLNRIRERLPLYFNKRSDKLLCEGNYYYNTKKCFIGFHGDTERRVVIGLRLGDTFPLHYQWYKHNKPITDLISFNINNGDMYIMGEVCVGTNWKSSSIPTLRHAAGHLKNIKQPEFKK